MDAKLIITLSKILESKSIYLKSYETKSGLLIINVTSERYVYDEVCVHDHIKRIGEILKCRIFLLDSDHIKLEIKDVVVMGTLLQITLIKNVIKNYTSYLYMIPIELKQNIMRNLTVHEVKFNMSSDFWKRMMCRYHPQYYKDLKLIIKESEWMDVYFVCKEDHNITYELVKRENWYKSDDGLHGDVSDRKLWSIISDINSGYRINYKISDTCNSEIRMTLVNGPYGSLGVQFAMIYPILCKYLDLEVFNYIVKLNISKLNWKKLFRWIRSYKNEYQSFENNIFVSDFIELKYIVMNIIYDQPNFKLWKSPDYERVIKIYGCSMLDMLYLYRRDLLDSSRLDILRLIINTCDMSEYTLLKSYIDNKTKV